MAILSEIGFAGSLDIFIMALLLYTLIVWVKQSRAISVLKGLLIVSGFYLVVRAFNLTMTAAIFEKFFAVILIALVVIFQEELRYLFERVATWSINKKTLGSRSVRLSRDEVQLLSRVLKDLAKEKIGALIVIRGKDLITRHLDGGIELNGAMSEPLLKSLFDPHSIGHDGAALVEGNRITRFSCHLPLSKNLKKVGQGGTRHTAALGLAEVSDALCLVVSEERGVISVAHNGKLTPMNDTEKLMVYLERFYEEISPAQQRNPVEDFVQKNLREKVVAIILSIALWFVIVFGAKTTYKTFVVPVVYDEIAEGLSVKKIEPTNVFVTFGAARNEFYFLKPESIRLIAKPQSSKGSQKVRIYPTDFQFPKNLSMEVLVPQEIHFEITDSEAAVQKTEEHDLSSVDRVKNTLKKVIPFTDGAAVETEPGVKEEPEIKTSVVAEEPKKAVSVPNLENVKPTEVIKFLEKSLEGETKVEPLISNKELSEKGKAETMSDSAVFMPLILKFLEKDSGGAANVLQTMQDDQSVEALSNLPAVSAAQILQHLPPVFASQLIEKLPEDHFRAIVEHMESQRGATIFLQLAKERREHFLQYLSKDKKKEIQELLTFPEDSAGRMMETRFLAFKGDLLVRDAIIKIRGLAKRGSAASYIYVVNAENVLKGVMNMRDMMLADEGAKLEDVMRKGLFTVNCFMDREKVMNELTARKFFAAPVVDSEDRLLGVVKAEQLINSAKEEGAEDMLKMFGASGDEKTFSPMWFSLRTRLPWLHVNLVTAFMAAGVVAFFEDIIAKITVLAIFLPVVAGQGGNAGAQSLAIVMRGLVMREIPPHKVKNLIFKETMIGIINGVVIGVVTALIAWIWKSNPYLGLVIGLGMIVNLAIAGLAGSAIPLIMKAMKLDPAQCSNIILTTVTDVMGFMAFLGFAVLFQEYLV